MSQNVCSLALTLSTFHYLLQQSKCGLAVMCQEEDPS